MARAMPTAILILLFLLLAEECCGKCNWTAASGCDDLLTADPRASFSRHGKDKCRLVRNYYYCLLREGECEPKEVTPRIIAYLHSMKLTCRTLNGEVDGFHHGCRDVALDKCEMHLQDKVSDLRAQGQAQDFALCAALRWGRLCMLENASCDAVFVETALHEAQLRFGDHICNAAAGHFVNCCLLMTVLLCLVPGFVRNA